MCGKDGRVVEEVSKREVRSAYGFWGGCLSLPRPGTNWADWSDAMGREMYLRRALDRLKFEYPSDDAS
jgi:hypothetical protein